MGLYERAIRPALFLLDAERAHNVTLAVLQQRWVQEALRRRLHPAADSRLRQTVLGLSFEHPVGLAAGLDKHGSVAPAWDAIGFAFAEFGTVTPLPQPGNPRPRLFRLPSDRAIINRFGFNSVGAPQVADNLAGAVPPALRAGINLGKNKQTSIERAADDYVRAVDTLHQLADYFVINVSSPNTEHLRDLQEAQQLRALVGQVTARVAALSRKPIPVLVKVSPDAPASDLLRSVDAALEGGAAGVVATNTTIARVGLRSGERSTAEAGGLSGAPLRQPANAICRLLFGHLRRRVPIIGVGGVFTANEAYERIRSGASLVQLYTALVYSGPAVVTQIVDGLGELLSRDGLSNISEAIGVDVS